MKLYPLVLRMYDEINMTQQRKQLYFILFVVFLEVVGFGIVIPIFPQLLGELSGLIPSETAKVGGYLVVVYALMQFVFAPITGGLADQYGRRPIILFSLFVFVIDYILLALAPNLFWLVIGRVIGGIAGSTIGTAHAYVTDISNKDNRTKYFGLLGAAMSVGLIFGPAIGGVLGEVDLRLPFWVSAAVIGVAFILGLFIMPESLKPANKRKFDFLRANPIGALKQIGQYKWVSALILVLCFMEMATIVYPTTWAFYTIHKFGWSMAEVGYSLTFLGIFMVVMEGGMVGIITKKIGNTGVAYLGLSISALSMLLYGLATQTWMIYIILVINAVGVIGSIGLRSIMSYQVPENAQGELQGAITSATSIVAIFSPLIMTQIYGFTSNPQTDYYLPGTAYFVGAIFVLIGMLIFANANRKAKFSTRENDLMDELKRQD